MKNHRLGANPSGDFLFQFQQQQANLIFGKAYLVFLDTQGNLLVITGYGDGLLNVFSQSNLSVCIGKSVNLQ